MNPSRRLRPVPVSPPPAPPSELLFCAVCQVSIARSEIESGEARRTPRGRTFCGVCATSTPAERDRRRAELETEFADDAPIAIPAPRAPAPRSAAGGPRSSDDEVLPLRVGELERAAFRLQARVASLEERLEEVLRRLG